MSALQEATIWRSYDWMFEAFDGYLVTEAGDLNWPIAFVDATQNGDVVALEAARAIAAAPSVLDGPKSRLSVEYLFDLRNCDPMPGWVYGCKCQPLDDPEAALRTPCPPDIGMLKTMARQMGLAIIDVDHGGPIQGGRLYCIMDEDESKPPLRPVRMAEAVAV
ncbi:MAG TPA: hypothetical protein VHY37_02490 [Tepidisphaeraceae bacterium]|jgi:hypothetical protein|nr:hypothetical protein [Tepidisphaeraceae bacterium]